LLKCPECGQEMESGYINLWSPAGRAIVAYVFMSWKDYTKEHKEAIKGKAGLAWANMDIEAYRCQSCQYIVFSYEKKEKHEFEEEGKVADYEDVEKYLR
jgi:rubredoxin